MSTTLIASYAVFSLLLFYQQLHIKTLQGANQAFGMILSVFAFAAMLAGLAFLVFYGYTVSWLGALGLFGIALLVKVFWFGVEAKLGLRGLAPFISLAGLVGIPIAAYFMWTSLPK